MGENTGVAWCDATYNPWEGCQHAGPGCDNCYAEARDQRFHQGAHFGPGAPRKRMSEATFNRPMIWNERRRAYNAAMNAGEPWPKAQPVPPEWVFTLSLGDFFDNAVPAEWRRDAWKIIRCCPHLRFQIVTKRVGNALRMLPEDWHVPASYGHAYSHVGIIATVTDQREYDRDVPKLLDLKRTGVKWVGLSIEPQQGPIRIGVLKDDLDWVIIGGESAQGGRPARPFHLTWAEWLLGDCTRAGIPVFVKQLGSHPIHMVPHLKDRSRLILQHKAGADPREWPAHLRVQEMPTIYDGGLIRNRLAAIP